MHKFSSARASHCFTPVARSLAMCSRQGQALRPSFLTSHFARRRRQVLTRPAAGLPMNVCLLALELRDHAGVSHLTHHVLLCNAVAPCSHRSQRPIRTVRGQPDLCSAFVHRQQVSPDAVCRVDASQCGLGCARLPGQQQQCTYTVKTFHLPLPVCRQTAFGR